MTTGSGEPAEDSDVLEACFTLGPDDLALLEHTSRAPHRLARALLLVWARAERTLTPDPALPAPVIADIAAQLGLDPEVLEAHKNWPATRAADAEAVRRHLGLRSFETADAKRLTAFLETTAAHTGNSAALLDAAEDWMIREQVLRPAGGTTIERLVYAAWATAEDEIFARIREQLAPGQCEGLDGICLTDGGPSVLSMLQAPPRVPSAASILAECRRLELIRSLMPETIEWGAVTHNRLRQWAQVVRRLDARVLRRYPPAKRYTLLAAFLQIAAEDTTDAIVEMLDTLVGRAFSRTDVELTLAKAEQVHVHAESVRMFRTLAAVLLDPAIPPERVRDEVSRRIPRERVNELVERAASFEQTETAAFLACLDRRFPNLREFTPLVLDTLRFASGRAGSEVLEALAVLRAMNAGHLRKVPAGAPVGFLPARLRKVIVASAGVDRHAWELCLLSEVRAELRAGEITVDGSRRFAPWDTDLYSAEVWDRRRDSWFTEASLPRHGEAYVARVIGELHALTAEVARRLPRNASARVEGGRLVVTPLEKLDVPPQAAEARRLLVGLLPWVSLPDLLMEVDRWCPFTRALLHLAQRREPTPAHVAAIRPALFGVLVAEATNIGLATMARASGIPEGQLRRVYDWYFHEDGLRQAITLLIHYHRSLPLTARFGSGTTSSSDGIRFGVAASALNARHNPRYFGIRRGVTIYNFVLDGLLYQDAPAIEEHYVDTHGATDVLFGLFALVGKRFAPRLRDLPDQVLYRGRKGDDYGALNPVIRSSIRTGLIIDRWDDLNRLAASLKDGLAVPSHIVAKLQGMRRQNPLQQAIVEIGRIDKTRHILTMADDPRARRRVLVGLNKQERLHKMARDVCFSRQGRFGDRGYEAQLARASSLSLVLNAMIVWATRYLGAAAAELARRGQPVPDDAWQHLSPLLWKHVQLVGDYRFDEATVGDGLRPLRRGEA